MRYYDIQAGSLHYTSVGANGSNPGALNIEMDISQVAADATQNGSWVRVWGIGLGDIRACQGLINQPISIKGGMMKGLPLANPAEAGPLGSGIIWQAYGNWQGTDQTVEFIISPSGMNATTGGPSPQLPAQPVILNWKKGQQLTGPLQQALQAAFPQMKIVMNIASKYAAPSDQPGFHHGLANFSEYIRKYTQMLGGPTSQGVSLVAANGSITASDETSTQQSGTINYQDLVGQPTWLGVDKISIKVVMRGDLTVGTNITLPKTLITNTPGGGTSQGGATASGAPQTSLTFQGTFKIQSLRHVGNFRQADASSWVTIIEANTSTSGGGGSGGGSSAGDSGTATSSTDDGSGDPTPGR